MNRPFDPPAALRLPYRLHMAGAVRLRDRDGEDVTPRSRKARGVLIYLAAARGPVGRDRLAALLWSDRGEAQARASLRQALYELRVLVDDGSLAAGRDEIALDPRRVEDDLAHFTKIAATRDFAAVATALDAWRPPLLDGLDGLSDAFDDWLRDERTALADLAVRSFLPLADAACDAGSAARIATALQRLDPLDEAIARAGIRADLAAGDRAGAARRTAALKDRLSRDLGVAPSPETEAAARGIKVNKAGTTTPLPMAAPATQAMVQAPRRWRALLVRHRVWLAALMLTITATGAALWWRQTAAPVVPSVAVLPFETLASGRDYFTAGISEEILNMLATQDKLKVLGRISSARLDGEDGLATARRLGVTHIVDGSVRSAGNHVLVIVRMIRVADGVQTWSQRFDRNRADIFAVQKEIATAVAAHLATGIGYTPAPGTRPDVYDRYLSARSLARERRVVTLDAADKLLREAIALDPSYAPALAELAQVTMLRANQPAYYGYTPYEQAVRDAEALARRAVALDPALGDGYAALGLIRLSRVSALPFYQRAVALNPQRADFHRWLGDALMERQRVDEAVQEYERAVAIDPLWGLSYEHLADALHMVGRDDERRALVARFLAISTDRRAKLMVLQADYEIDFRLADALRVSEQLYRDDPDERLRQARHIGALAALGETARAAEVARHDPFARAVLSDDWSAVAQQAADAGARYWELTDKWWGVSTALVATGHVQPLVRAYDLYTARYGIDGIDAHYLIAPGTILALRKAGRTADAGMLLQKLRDDLRATPDRGGLAVSRIEQRLSIALLEGDRGTALAMLERLGRGGFVTLLPRPARSLRTDPLFQPIVDDPRFIAFDRQLLGYLNRERAKLGLAALPESRWYRPYRSI